MTNSDPVPAKAEEGSLRDGLIAFALSIGLIFLVGAMVGFFSAASHQGAPGFIDLAIGTAMLALTALCGWLLFTRMRRLLGRKGPPLGKSQRKVRNIWIYIIAGGALLGAVIGMMSELGGQSSTFKVLPSMIGPGSITPSLAVILLVGLALLTLATIMYFRLIDEHDLAAQEKASLVSVNLYVALYLGWTIAANGQLVGAVQHQAIFVIVVFSYCAVWLWRRYF